MGGATIVRYLANKSAEELARMAVGLKWNELVGLVNDVARLLFSGTADQHPRVAKIISSARGPDLTSEEAAQRCIRFLYELKTHGYFQDRTGDSIGNALGSLQNRINALKTKERDYDGVQEQVFATLRRLRERAGDTSE